MEFNNFKAKCPWRMKIITDLIDLYNPDCFMVGNIYPIGSAIIKEDALYIKTEIKDTKDMWFNRRHWMEIASICATTKMTCSVWNCTPYYTKEMILKQISLW